MLKVVTIVGTRPEIIRLATTIELLDKYTDHTLVHTGQNYDYELNEVFFEELGVRKPDIFLGIDTSSLGTVIGNVIIESEKVFREVRPDALVLLGDTNSALSAIMAKRMKIPIYHMEAGNRSFDRNVPEETNRRMVDHISDFNLPYTEHARRNLLDEGIHPRRLYITGSPLAELIAKFRDKIEGSDVLERLELESGKYFIVSLHREENVDSNERLRSLISTLNHLASHYDMPIIVSTHPRTRNRLDKMGGVELDRRVRDMKPFGYYDYNKLQMNAYCALSDSGTIAEESAMLDFPAVSPRDAIERPEAIDTGNIVFTGLDRDAIVESIEAVVAIHRERKDFGLPSPMPEAYDMPNSAERVVKLILGTARLSNQWDGIRTHDHV
ncbi:UDP-N-acetylglucosamine 2-epimerase (non-hydrolyzing) [Altererythrobacter salegens]|uniref:UDP-N-acetylglucosamine 2-epimerase (Non-hydrolyzing) n=1 Tax=Croceibacterium salegens TaxID=1737568 RepID=A0A6I4T054_9SPHN|nr:UDP-N-acetylglucosamine 2-epimerase (non-hydrolyzing) [Croceibacterium salegens]MXO60556.1 UDP-N-acetylglucosamine 2-epimerase (non-hydrolyzing) [Croceibacterium salegens]